MNEEKEKEKKKRKRKRGETKFFWRGRHPEEGKFFSRVSEDYWKTSKMAVRARGLFASFYAANGNSIPLLGCCFSRLRLGSSNFAQQRSFPFRTHYGIRKGIPSVQIGADMRGT
ncbi:hypothetical protein CEXT_139871 [Caerostris extrusa]|uniref:Uncharacterized protein n=1 Tax=Caerostris extrusa TaxID=172846 RepID=A0AAV4MZU1_CAEEX|nr:hypothetical protein CEXT_139871 [Caerostris extrusa]